MLESQRARLLREDHWTAQGLAQELYAMFSDDTSPLEVGSGIKFQAAPGVSFFDFGNVPSFDTPLFAGRVGGEPFTFSLVQAGVAPPGTPGEPGAPAKSPPASVYPGKLIAYLGSNSYNVTIYPNGTSAAGQDVQVKQLQGNDTMPFAVDGSVWALVSKVKGSYYMSNPVWG